MKNVLEVKKTDSGVLMGNVNAGIHCTAMAAVSFGLTSESVEELSQSIANPLLTIGLGIGTLVLLALALDTTNIVRRLKAQEERFRLYMDNSPVVAYLKDADGQYVYANTLLENLFGVKADHRTDLDYFPAELANELKKKDLQVLATGETLIIEESLPTLASIAQEWLSCRFRVTDSQGAHFIGGVLLDITERKRSEAQLKECADKLTRSNEELERFNLSASHDLRAPLRTISTRMQFLIRDLEKGSQDVQHQTEGITLAISRMDRLLNNLLAYSQAGMQMKSLEPTVSSTVVQAVLDSLQSLIQEKQAVVQVQKELPTVLADPTQLVQVFQNLISNGINFCQNKPKITISATCQAQECTFCVADNGIGISPGSEQRIFETFERLHRQSEYEGSGIGLSIVKRVIQQHGGRIWVKSELGQGSRFFFTLKEAIDAG